MTTFLLQYIRAPGFLSSHRISSPPPTSMRLVPLIVQMLTLFWLLITNSNPLVYNWNVHSGAQYLKYLQPLGRRLMTDGKRASVPMSWSICSTYDLWYIAPPQHAILKSQTNKTWGGGSWVFYFYALVILIVYKRTVVRLRQTYAIISRQNISAYFHKNFDEDLNIYTYK